MVGGFGATFVRSLYVAKDGLGKVACHTYAEFIATGDIEENSVFLLPGFDYLVAPWFQAHFAESISHALWHTDGLQVLATREDICAYFGNGFGESDRG